MWLDSIKNDFSISVYTPSLVVMGVLHNEEMWDTASDSMYKQQYWISTYHLEKKKKKN